MRPMPRAAVVARPRVLALTALRPSMAPKMVAATDTPACSFDSVACCSWRCDGRLGAADTVLQRCELRCVALAHAGHFLVALSRAARVCSRMRKSRSDSSGVGDELRRSRSSADSTPCDRATHCVKSFAHCAYFLRPRWPRLARARTLPRGRLRGRDRDTGNRPSPRAPNRPGTGAVDDRCPDHHVARLIDAELGVGVTHAGGAKERGRPARRRRPGRKTDGIAGSSTGAGRGCERCNGCKQVRRCRCG